MAYHLAHDEPVPDGVRRLATERLDHAIDALRTGEDPATAVHDARKDIKKIRSLLRLVRTGLGREVVHGEQDALRSAAALLSASRDAEVLGQTMDDLADRYVGRLPHPAFVAARELVTTAAAGGGATLTEQDEAAAREVAADRLAVVRGRLAEWPVERCDWDVVLAGLERSYRRGRDDLRRAPDGDAAQLHDWRKRVKDLWYQQRVVRGAWPAVMKAQASQAHVLTELLGDHHDLDVLRGALVAADGGTDRAGAARALVERDGLLELIDVRSDELLAGALLLGRRVYAEKPAAFARRLRRYVRTMREEAAERPAVDPGP